ncbi:MAG: hypothetical protein ACI9YO_002936 [Gammaproteobacteria bacterium]|jgi:hypothetical protein
MLLVDRFHLNRASSFGGDTGVFWRREMSNPRRPMSNKETESELD